MVDFTLPLPRVRILSDEEISARACSTRGRQNSGHWVMEQPTLSGRYKDRFVWNIVTAHFNEEAANKACTKLMKKLMQLNK